MTAAITTKMERKLETAFEPRQASLLAEVITDAYNTLVKASDFAELKEVMRELAEAQKHTDQQMGELAAAQQRTELRVDTLGQRMEELAATQQRTDQRMGELAAALKELADVERETRSELGGLSRSVSYALENEAYRALPAFLRQQHGIEISERFVRREIGGKEINVFGRATRAGQPVLIVGEVKLRLDERRGARQAEADVFKELDEKIEAVRQEYRDATLVPLLVTHYARPAFLRAARERGVIVVQSFEW